MNQYLKLIPTNPDGVNEESDHGSYSLKFIRSATVPHEFESYPLCCKTTCFPRKNEGSEATLATH